MSIKYLHGLVLIHKIITIMEGLLLDMLFGKVIQHPHTHFLPVRCGKQLDSGTVKFRTEPCFGIQTYTFRSIFLHVYHLNDRIPEFLMIYEKWDGKLPSHYCL